MNSNDILTEIAHRMCYKSFGELNDEVLEVKYGYNRMTIKLKNGKDINIEVEVKD